MIAPASIAELIAGQRVEMVPRLALTPQEAADALGISLRSLYEHVIPELNIVRRGRLRMIPTKLLASWVVENAERGVA